MAYNRNLYTSGTITYKDWDLSFKQNPVTGDIRTKTDAEAIKQAFKNLIFTNFNERPFRPNLSGGINDLLFEPIDNITTIELENRVRTLIENYEPRVRLLKVKAEGNDNNELMVTISFNMLNLSTPQQFTVILNRTR